MMLISSLIDLATGFVTMVALRQIPAAYEVHQGTPAIKVNQYSPKLRACAAKVTIHDLYNLGLLRYFL
jgi:hypothetical protein